MAVSGLSARSEFLYRERPRPRDRRAPAEPAPEPRPAAPTTEDIDPGLTAASYAARFTADLYALGDIAAAQAGDGGADETPPADGSVATLRALVLAVRAGDIEGARVAAKALEHDERFVADPGPPAAVTANGGAYEALFDMLDEDLSPQP